MNIWPANRSFLALYLLSHGLILPIKIINYDQSANTGASAPLSHDIDAKAAEEIVMPLFSIFINYRFLYRDRLFRL